MNQLGNSNFFKDPQNIIAVGVTLISMCALIVSIFQTQIMQEERQLIREHAKASVWPRLSLLASKSHNPEDYSVSSFNIEIINDGVGPAIITDVRISFEDQPAPHWWALFRMFDIPDTLSLGITNRTINKSVVRAGQEVLILSLDGNLPLAQAFYEHFDRIKFEIIYESIYGDKWKLLSDVEKDETIEVDPNTSFSEEEQFDTE